MKKMLLILVVAAFAALTTSSFGQAAGPAGGPPATGNSAPSGKGGHGANPKRMQEMLAKLNLTDAQKAQVKDLIGKAMVAHKDLAKKIKSGAISKEQAKPEMQKIGQELREGIAKILTPDQKKQLAAEMKAGRKNKGNKGGGTATPPPAN